MEEAILLLTKILPPLLSLGKELWHLFDGDIDAIIAEIEDRKADVVRRRARNDAALKAKYPKP